MFPSLAILCREPFRIQLLLLSWRSETFPVAVMSPLGQHHLCAWPPKADIGYCDGSLGDRLSLPNTPDSLVLLY